MSGGRERGEAGSARWVAFTLVCVAYLATTTGEALLAPIYPVSAEELGLDLAGAGTAFALLAGSIAVANIVGGLLLRRHAANHVVALAVATTGLGSVLAAVSQGAVSFLASQVLIGCGAGLLYPAAIMSVGVFAGEQRRGFAMGIFGVFFSGGLVAAAALSALGTVIDWRWSFGIGAIVAVVATGGALTITDAPTGESTGPIFAGLRSVLGTPTLVGVVGGVSQYATVSFLPVFAVEVWGRSEATAAGILLVGRVLSVPAKLIAGSIADRRGPLDAAGALGLVLAVAGTAWALLPSATVGAIGAIVFTAAVSALFPLANLLAFERVGRKGPALGAFRSLQLGAGAVAGVVLGVSANEFGLRPALAVVVLVPLLLLALRTIETEHDRPGVR